MLRASEIVNDRVLSMSGFAADDLLVTSLDDGGNQTESTSRNRSATHRKSRKCRSRVNQKRIRYESIQDLQSCLCKHSHCNLRLLYHLDDKPFSWNCVRHYHILFVLWRIYDAVKSAQEHEKGLLGDATKVVDGCLQTNLQAFFRKPVFAFGRLFGADLCSRVQQTRPKRNK